MLVDQTFREFTDDPAASRTDIENLWLSGSYTKVYGADGSGSGMRSPRTNRSRGSPACTDFSSTVFPRAPSPVPSPSSPIVRSSSARPGGILRANERYLKSHVDGVPDLAAPVWFDRGRQGFDGDRAARRLLRHGVLVCAGSFFGDPRGVRIALTRRSFPEDLDAYLRWVDRS